MRRHSTDGLSAPCMLYSVRCLRRLLRRPPALVPRQRRRVPCLPRTPRPPPTRLVRRPRHRQRKRPLPCHRPRNRHRRRLRLPRAHRPRFRRPPQLRIRQRLRRLAILGYGCTCPTQAANQSTAQRHQAIVHSRHRPPSPGHPGWAILGALRQEPLFYGRVLKCLTSS
jgi:hypothetical protein